MEELETLFTQLEKTLADQKTIDSIFRIIHTLKGNAAGMGFEVISKFAHALEDMFSEIKQAKITIEDDIFTSLFKAVDTLKELVQTLSDDVLKVNYRGIQRKLEVIVENSRKVEDAKQEKKVKKKPLAKKSVAKSEKEEQQQLEESQAQLASQQEEQLKRSMPIEEEKEMISVEEKNTKKISFSDMVQVPVEKLDNLLNHVGELTIERDSA